jgi:hypothetical protein
MGITEILAPDGYAYIEVQYLPDLLTNNAFDLVYHEHRNFFSLSSLERAANLWGLYVVDAVLTDRQGGSLRVALSKDSSGSHTHPRVEALRASEVWLGDLSAYAGMQGRVERIRTRLLHMLDEQRSRGRVIVGYGAPAKATTLLNFCGINDNYLSHVVDTTVAKQGRYIPGTGLKIFSPEKHQYADVFLLLVWNYLPQIVRKDRQSTWIVPIPSPVII